MLFAQIFDTSEKARRDSKIPPGTPDRSFVVLYQLPGEALSETTHTTMHGFICTALARTATGYHLYFAAYVLPASWLTRPHLIAIEPFRRVLYPAMLRRRHAGMAAYAP